METRLVNWKPLKDYCRRLLQTQGMPEDEALIVADCLVDADLCGVESHGVSRMTIYLKRLEEQVVNPVCKIEIEREYPGSAAINACNSMGMVAGKRIMQICIDKAKQNGSCFITVNHSNHFGMAYYYVKMAAEQNMVGITATNAPPNIAPWGSFQAYMGTNPVAIGVPTGAEPIILDMAPSVVAMGKVIMAAKLGKPIPEGWALTAGGQPTTDPQEGMKGTVLPIGGPKGYGIALFVDILCGALSGAQFGPHLGNMWNDFVNPQNVGHIFSCIDISKFLPPEEFKKKADQIRREIKALPRNPGVAEIFMPGEIEWKRAAERREQGIAIPETVYQELKQLGEKYRAAFDL
ncbi:MAG: Ldh family oxidoreductase [Treponema sp.]|jgi:LDH2 family malate/lactate/ureidoglycolate dehydrogenase|nr:Ldh family oxidoreductase [Treponema sp.]